MATTMATRSLKRDIIVILSIKITIVLFCAAFIFGPHQRPQVSVDAASVRILGHSTGGRQEPRL